MTDAGWRRVSGVRRVTAGVALGAVIAAGLGVHFLLPDTAATDIAGDALYAAAVYAFIILLIPRRHPLLVGAIALAWCVGIELFQLTVKRSGFLNYLRNCVLFTSGFKKLFYGIITFAI